MVELLSPAGNKENLITAIKHGANAVYLGLKDFSARKPCANFDFDELKWSVAYAKTFNVKVYLTVNTLIKDCELVEFINSVIKAYNLGVDAFILQDMFLGKVIKEYLPNAELHLSTQAGVCNVYGATIAKKYGFSRVILARETRLEDIKEICKIIDTEVFVQGALCSSMSGHCYFSSVVGGNSGNRGNCKQPCRKKYTISGNNIKKSGYSISLSDLCLSNKLDLFINLGVKSFKIEGRLRSKEYVAFATGYYRSVLDKKERVDFKKGLITTFNRGDYTEGLAFSQKSNFISSDIQSNKGLKVGIVGRVINDTLYFKDYYNYEEGDAFKIIRNNKEVGNATVVKQGDKLKILFKGNVKEGDEINITKDVSLSIKINDQDLLKDIYVDAQIKVGEKIKISCGDIVLESQNATDRALKTPTSTDEIIANFNKVDVYPFKVNLNLTYDGECFIPKSVLNNLRADLYYKLFYRDCKNIDKIAKYEDFSICNKSEKIDAKNKKCAIICKEIKLDESYTDVVYMPLDYKNIKLPNYINKRVWLYLPPFISAKNLKLIEEIVPKFYGVYVEGYYGLEYAKQNKLKVFAGTGLNIFNTLSLNILKNENVVECYVISKELSLNEISLFSSDAFVLNKGAIELMDLIYCPFSKDCKNCNKSNLFTLTDDNMRNFSLLRYEIDGCYFKVYNNAVLVGKNFNNQLHNFVTLDEQTINVLQDNDVNNIKLVIKNYTQGLLNKGIL